MAKCAGVSGKFSGLSMERGPFSASDYFRGLDGTVKQRYKGKLDEIGGLEAGGKESHQLCKGSRGENQRSNTFQDLVLSKIR